MRLFTMYISCVPIFANTSLSGRYTNTTTLNSRYSYYCSSYLMYILIRGYKVKKIMKLNY